MTTAIAEDIAEPKFEAQTIDDKILIGYGVAVGDVDGDKRPDILLADKKQFVWYQNPGPSKKGEPAKDWPKHIMTENLTEYDNVCIAARDINGDGKVEVAVGAQWNPGNTDDPQKSGAIFYLESPEDPTKTWNAVPIKPHEPTTHRMRWIKIRDDDFRLAVLPLHGLRNRGGEGTPVRVQIVTPPKEEGGKWISDFVDTGMNRTHNFTSIEMDGNDTLLLAGSRGIAAGEFVGKGKVHHPAENIFAEVAKDGFGEVAAGRDGKLAALAGITPMHGNRVVVIFGPEDTPEPPTPIILDDTLAQGHAIAAADLLDLKRPQIIAGWRNRNAAGKVGIKLYVPTDESGKEWTTYWIDDNTMACEDLKVADLDGDGKLDVVASGRGTRNVVIYWNRTE